MSKYKTLAEARAMYAADAAMFAEKGASFHGAVSYVSEDIRRNAGIVMDADIPALQTNPNAGIPSFLTQYVDPDVYEILFAPNNAAKILGEVRKGTWTDLTAMFPVVEHTGEVSSYGDFNTNGRAGANTNFPQRQSYLSQYIMEYGDLELDRAGLARINWVSELQRAGATVANKFANLTYMFGVSGLQNYGLLNDPNLPAALTPAPKAAGGTTWFLNGAPNATANEVFNDLVALFANLVNNTAGLVDAQTKMVLAMSPGPAVALTFTNAFGVNVYDLLKKNYPNIRFETAVQYGAVSTSNPQGVTGGNFVQLIAEELEGQKTGYCAFNEKARSHPIVRMLSSFQQKVTQGTWGSIIRMPAAFSQMLGV